MHLFTKMFLLLNVEEYLHFLLMRIKIQTFVRIAVE